jgi:hypothetical protein
MSGKRKSAERAIEQFHSDFNAGNFRKIYQESDDLIFKRGQTENALVEELESIKNRMGTVKKSKVVSTSSRNHDRGTDLYLTCETEFTNGIEQESFTYVFIGDKILLEGYEFNP